MKKFLAILMAMMLVFSLCGVAMADGGNNEGGGSGLIPDPILAPTVLTHADETKVAITKVYKLENADTVSPAETFNFTIAKEGVTDSAYTKDTMPMFSVTSFDISFAEGEATTAGATESYELTLPTYDKVGIYTYKITETASNTAGVTYNSKPLYLKVTVIEQSGKVRVTAVHLETTTGSKTDKMTNIYSAGSLSVSKEVTGLLGDKTKGFDITVNFTAPSGKDVDSAITYVVGTETKTLAWTNGTATAKITLKDAGTVTFTNIPYGVTYSVTEADYTGNNGGYDAAEYTYSDTDQEIDSAAETVKVTNNKGGTPDTGVYTDNMPYIMLMGIVVLAGAVMLMKRRSYNG
jgi:pilin isopeptide linkage protein